MFHAHLFESLPTMANYKMADSTYFAELRQSWDKLHCEGHDSILAAERGARCEKDRPAQAVDPVDIFAEHTSSQTIL